MPARKLTAKRESFCQEYIKNKENGSAAYRDSHNAKNMKAETITNAAYKILQRGDVRARIEKLRVEVAKRNEITCDSLVDELEEARLLAKNSSQISVMVSATMGKAKICGLEKQVVDMKVEGVVFNMSYGIDQDDEVNDYD